MSKKNKGRAITLATVVCVIVIAVTFILLPFDNTKRFEEKEYNYALDTFIDLDNIPIFSQETGFTCFAVSMVIEMNFLGSPMTESEFIKAFDLQDRDAGMIPKEWISLANQAFNAIGYSVTSLNPRSEAEILNIITESLLNELPVIFYYSAVDDWNKPNFNTHYSIIFGIDMANGVVKISNPYGYLEDLSFSYLFDGLAFRSYKSEPFSHHIGRIVGYIKSNNIFVFEHN
jgi:hypothetical protein